MSTDIKSARHKHSVLTKILCILVIIGLLDAQTAIMQGWAWVTMLQDRIPEQGIEQALNTTFSGQYPCEKCQAIAELKEKKKQDPLLPELKDTQKHTIGLIPHTHTPTNTISRKRTRFEIIHSCTLYGVYLSVPGPPPRLA